MFRNTPKFAKCTLPVIASLNHCHKIILSSLKWSPSKQVICRDNKHFSQKKFLGGLEYEKIKWIILTKQRAACNFFCYFEICK